MSNEPRMDAGDEKSVKTAKTKSERIQIERERRLNVVMALPEGRSVIWGLLEQGKPFQTLFDRDPCQHAFNAGYQHNSRLLLDELMRVCPDKFYLAQKEAKEESNV